MAIALQECPASGIMCATFIEMAPRSQCKTKYADSIKICDHDAYAVAAISGTSEHLNFSMGQRKAKDVLKRCIVIEPKRENEVVESRALDETASPRITRSRSRASCEGWQTRAAAKEKRVVGKAALGKEGEATLRCQGVMRTCAPEWKHWWRDAYGLTPAAPHVARLSPSLRGVTSHTEKEAPTAKRQKTVVVVVSFLRVACPGEVQSTPYKEKEKICVVEALNNPHSRRASIVVAIQCALTLEAALLRSENQEFQGRGQGVRPPKEEWTVFKGRNNEDVLLQGRPQSCECAFTSKNNSRLCEDVLLQGRPQSCECIFTLKIDFRLCEDVLLQGRPQSCKVLLLNPFAEVHGIPGSFELLFIAVKLLIGVAVNDAGYELWAFPIRLKFTLVMIIDIVLELGEVLVKVLAPYEGLYLWFRIALAQDVAPNGRCERGIVVPAKGLLDLPLSRISTLHGLD
ncbi:hypothetical protein GIB67_011765 [Kingdonia uniflora]|uniref:Uncharacterized protein n=1 Tax=Kingdonia uniflora TaxID=39325 RepID=A0A7J7NY74_9MAGN|nr:hypothetical protein GIB67_011765 [Kingdonia uniflora]